MVLNLFNCAERCCSFFEIASGRFENKLAHRTIVKKATRNTRKWIRHFETNIFWKHLQVVYSNILLMLRQQTWEHVRRRMGINDGSRRVISACFFKKRLYSLILHWNPISNNELNLDSQPTISKSRKSDKHDKLEHLAYHKNMVNRFMTWSTIPM